ncbi:MAG: PAS domain S-box protein, partial [Dehalococcoidia bacterium]
DCTFQFIRDKQGKATGILAQGRDITERKRAEETLQKTENIYRLLAENISDTVWMMDMDLNVTWASPSSAKLRGFSLDEILALPLDGQLTPESLGKAVNLWGKWMHVEKKGRTPDPNGSISIELEFICKDGHTVLLDCALQFIRDEKGKATGILAAGRDITERRAAELAREESEKNYRLLAENTADVVTIMDMNLNITWLSSSCEKLTGYTREEQKSLPLEKQMTQESLERALNQFAAELEREKSGTAEPGRYQDMELEIYHKDGHTLWTENRIQFIRDGQGKAVGILMQGRDITERRQAEDALKASEAQYRLLSEHMTDTVWLMDMNLKVTYHSPSGEKLRGLTPQEIMTMPLEQTLTPESLKLASELFFEEIPKVKADPDYNPVRTMELEYYCKDGTTIWAESKFSIIRDSSGKAVSILGEGRDITKRKQVEEALQESETQYRLLSEHTADTVWLMDMNLKPTYQSPSAEKLRGYTPQEVLDLPLEKQITPESLKLALEVFSEEIPKVEADPGYNPVLTLELEYYRKDGTTVWAESTFSLIRDENGKPISILAEARDITERREAERRIRESEILYRSLIETSPDAIGLMDINGTIIMYNKQALEVFGFELTDDLRGKNIMDMVSPEYYKESIKNAEKLQKSEIIRNWEVTSHKKDGRLFWVEISTSMIFDEEGKPKSIMAVFKDITERKLSEEKLAKSIESLKKTFNDAINTMVKIVEMRDPYTAGHQQKVADLSTAIAREMKFGDTRIEQLKMAAVIHDIGKMYVPSDILSKPGKLTNMEFRLVQTHSQCGYDIVKSMDFPSPVAEAVLQHHERLDGSGYPNKLKGEDMLLEAKILAVADVTEAMFSHRPYRPALGIEKALEEISKNKGRLYDPDVVDACLEIFNSGKFEFKSI